MRKKILIGLVVGGVALLLAGCASLFGPNSPTSVRPVIPLTPVDPASFVVPESLPVPVEGEYIEGQIIVGYRDDSALAKAAELVGGVIVHKEPRIKAALIRLNGTSVLEALGKISWAVA